jgi:hypothetical protein
MNGVDHEE